MRHPLPADPFHPCSSQRFAELGCGERKVAGGARKEAVCLGPPRAIAVQLADRGLDRERQLGVGLNLPCHTLHQRQCMLLGVSGNGLVSGGPRLAADIAENATR